MDAAARARLSGFVGESRDAAEQAIHELATHTTGRVPGSADERALHCLARAVAELTTAGNLLELDYRNA